MKKILIAAALIVSGLLSGCNQLTQYTVSEQEINQALQKRNHFAKDIGLKGVADAHIELQKEMEVVDAKVAPEKLQSVIQALLPYLNQSLRSYFSQQPAYVLREDASTGEALAKKYAKGIEVKPGEIVIPFTN